MGKTSSKSAVTHNVDPQIHRELHSEKLEHHEFLIYIILVQLLIKVYTILQRRERKRAFKLAKSMNNLAEVDKVKALAASLFIISSTVISVGGFSISHPG